MNADLFDNDSLNGSDNDSENSFQKILNFLNRLDDSGLTYTLEHNTEETIMVLVSAEDERWEVEFFADGDVQVEVFYSVDDEDELEGEEALERLFLEDADYIDDEDEDEDEDEDSLDEEGNYKT